MLQKVKVYVTTVMAWRVSLEKSPTAGTLTLCGLISEQEKTMAGPHWTGLFGRKIDEVTGSLYLIRRIEFIGLRHWVWI